MEKVVLPNDVMLDEVSRLLDEGREVVIQPKGQSMLPFIRGGQDSVRLRKPERLKVGDIVLAHFNGNYIIHRIYAIDGENITLMGDGNLQGVEFGTSSEVKGVVTEIITSEGKVTKPSSGIVWRRLLPIRKYLLKCYRKRNCLFCKY